LLHKNVGEHTAAGKPFAVAAASSIAKANAAAIAGQVAALTGGMPIRRD
jgi:hypothetical protein